MKEKVTVAENVRYKNYIIRFSVYLILLLTFLFITSSLLQKPIYKALSSDDAIIIENSQIKGEERDFSYYIKTKRDFIKSEFTVLIPKQAIDKIGEKYITLFTPQMQCEAFELFINDKSIAVEGDIIEFNSTIWTKHYNYTLESSLFDREENELKIVQYGRYISGGLGYTFLIDGYRRSLFLKNYEAIDIHQAIFGTAIFTLLLILLMLSLLKEKRIVYSYMLLTLIFMMIGYIEYFEISNLGFDFIVFKKMVVSSNLLSVGFGTILFMTFYNKTKNSRLFLILYSLIILIPTFIAPDMPSFKTTYTVLTFAIVPLLAYWGYLSITSIKIDPRSYTLLTLTATTVFYTSVWNISEVAKIAYMDSPSVVIMPAFIITILTFILLDMHDLKMDVAASNKKYSSVYKRSIIDGLTKLYNADYMKDIVKSTNTPFVFIVYDVDDFKNINDSFGHVAGDEALIKISEIVSSMLRNGDFLGRYGGDEFILLLRLSSIESLMSILERIRKKIEHFSFEFEGRSISMTISLGYYIVYEKEDYKSILQKADKALYQAKELGKNTIVAYSESEHQ